MEAYMKLEKKKSRGNVILYFNAVWCQPCSIMDKTMKGIRNKYKAKLKVVTVDIDKEPRLAKEFDVYPIPHLFFLKNGQPIANIIGRASSAELEAKISELY